MNQHDNRDAGHHFRHNSTRYDTGRHKTGAGFHHFRKRASSHANRLGIDKKRACFNKRSHRDAWLTGVCARIAAAFNWKAWALRGLFILFLLVEPLAAVGVYAGLSLLFYLVDRAGPRRAGKSDDLDLESPELAGRSARINELERRFREWEDSLKP